MENNLGGILLVDKAEGETSHDVVQKVRRVLGRPKVGHAGTLDPFATGLLVILVGKATKLSGFITAEEKIYEAALRLGIETDTYDKTGKVVRKTDPSSINREMLEEALAKFLGEIEQIPPSFSAIRVNGKRAYEMARKGEEVRLAPRKVTVWELAIKEFRPPRVQVRLRCSSGTYVRSIASDLGKMLGCGAHLEKLRRTGAGKFRVQEAIASSELECLGKRQIIDRLISPVEALGNMAEVDIDRDMAKRIRSGYCPRMEELGISSLELVRKKPFVKLVTEEELVAIGSVEESTPGKSARVLRLKRVLL